MVVKFLIWGREIQLREKNEPWGDELKLELSVRIYGF